MRVLAATDLCIACASSPLPKKSEKEAEAPHRTPCCDRIVCPACLQNNPRLERYCIMCQSTCDVVARPQHAKMQRQPPATPEAEGFVIGTDSDDENDDSTGGDRAPIYESGQPEPSEAATEDLLPPAYDTECEHGGPIQDTKEKGDGHPTIHFVKPADTLAGLALHYNVPGRQLALMNHLPPSTLTTTPHLLHTRPFILLPPCTPSSSTQSHLPPSEQRLQLLIRQFQMKAKVSDWAVAKAYIEVVLLGRQAEAKALGIDEADLKQGGEVDEALLNWKTDEEWERNSGLISMGKGKATKSTLWTSGGRGIAAHRSS